MVPIKWKDEMRRLRKRAATDPHRSLDKTSQSIWGALIPQLRQWGLPFIRSAKRLMIQFDTSESAAAITLYADEATIYYGRVDRPITTNIPLTSSALLEAHGGWLVLKKYFPAIRMMAEALRIDQAEVATDSTALLANLRRAQDEEMPSTDIGNFALKIHSLLTTYFKSTNYVHIPGTLNPADEPSRHATPRARQDVNYKKLHEGKGRQPRSTKRVTAHSSHADAE